MLETVSTEEGAVTIRATVRRVGVYLDNHSIINLAKGDPERRGRILLSFRNGADLMFSPTNASEIVGPERQASVEAVRSFLDAIGPHWFPLEGMDVVAVMAREAAGADRSTACMSSSFLNRFFAARNIQLYGEQRLDLVEADFFRLGLFLDWLQPQRAEIRARLSEWDGRIGQLLMQIRTAYEQNRQGFDTIVPEPAYDDARPATFVFYGLVRRLVFEARAFKFKKGDAADLCHAVAGPAFATFATLDKQWKRRVLSLPKPNKLARVYYEPELDQLVSDLEIALA